MRNTIALPDFSEIASETLPAVEEIGGDGSVVYQFPPTAPGEPTVVFVVDRNADI